MACKVSKSFPDVIVSTEDVLTFYRGYLSLARHLMKDSSCHSSKFFLYVTQSDQYNRKKHERVKK